MLSFFFIVFALEDAQLTLLILLIQSWNIIFDDSNRRK